MRVLLLGGGGLMGAPTARRLIAAGHDVTVLTRGSRERPPGTAAIVADRSDRVSLSAALEGQQFDCTVDFLAFDDRDVEALQLVPHAVLGRYVLISSGQVYLVTADPRPPFVEEDSDRPLMPEPEAGTADQAEWAYGVGKRRAEAALIQLRRQHGVRATALRLPVVMGEGDTSRRLWAYVERILDGSPVLLPGGGEALVRFIWAEDVARAIVALAEGAPAAGPVYNLAMESARPLREVVALLAHSVGVEVDIVPCSFADLAAAGLGRQISPYSGPWCSQPDPTRARLEWGFAPSPIEAFAPDLARTLARERPKSHPGYAARDAERRFADRVRQPR